RLRQPVPRRRSSFHRHFRSAFPPLVLLLLSASPGVAWAQRQAATPEAEFAEAHRLYANQLYEQSAEGFARFREEYSDHPAAAEALYYEAVASLAVGREERAVELLGRFQRLYPV